MLGCLRGRSLSSETSTLDIDILEISLMKTRMPKVDMLLPVLVIIVFLAHAGIFWTHNPYDDAYISFRYARNLSRGKGLVFNEDERVEGYSNFLWVLVLSLLSKLGFDLPLISKVLGALFSIGTLAVTWQISRSLTKKKPISDTVPLVLLALSGPLALHSVNGLETAMFSFLVSAGIWLYLQGLSHSRCLYYSSLFLFLAALTRHEGLLIFCITIVHYLYIKNGHLSWYKKKEYFWIFIPPLLYSVYFLWRYSYYGYLLPNTFYAKKADLWSDIKLGSIYFGQFLTSAGGIIGFLGLPIIFLKPRSRQNWEILLIGIVLIYSLYIVLIGGDCFPLLRSLVPVLPIFYLLLNEAFWSLQKGFSAQKIGPVLKIVSIFVFLAYTFLPTTREYKRIYGTYDYFEKRWIFLGKQLKKRLPSEATIALSPLGAVSYYSELKTIDILGLTDVHIAHTSAHPEVPMKGHQKWDGEYALSRAPDYVILDNGIVLNEPVEDMPPPYSRYPWEQDIVKSAKLKQNYEPILLDLDSGLYLLCFRRKDSPY